MKSGIILVIFVAILFSCNKEQARSPIAEGTYSGTFLRSTPNSRYAPSNVTLTLSDGKFSGHADTGNYPEICSGTYLIVGKEIEFTNQCIFTANFDWTLILDGNFTLTVSGKNVIMSKKAATETDAFDNYFLTLQ